MSEALLRGHDSAIAEYGELVPQRDLCDTYLAYPVRLDPAVEQLVERCEDSIVLPRIRSQLRNRLRNKYIEPVQTLRLVSLDIVVRFRQNGSNARSARTRRIPDDSARGLVAERIRGGGVGARAQMVERVLVREGSCASQGGEVQGAVVVRGRFPKDEELYEEED